MLSAFFITENLIFILLENLVSTLRLISKHIYFFACICVCGNVYMYACVNVYGHMYMQLCAHDNVGYLSQLFSTLLLKQDFLVQPRLP